MIYCRIPLENTDNKAHWLITFKTSILAEDVYIQLYEFFTIKLYIFILNTLPLPRWIETTNMG